MARNIFIVDAHIVQSNGVFAYLSGYPKTFDSNNYSGDVAKAKRRAEGDMAEQWSAMCKRDDRLIQVVALSDVYGNLIEKKSMGDFTENQPEPET